jgi:hypothetical protein
MNQHPRLFQLSNCDGEDAALFICFDSIEDVSDSEVVEAIEKALEDCKDEDNPLDAAEEILDKQNIERTYITSYANTGVI